MPTKLTVYRSRFSLLAVLAGCLIFLVSLILDRLGLLTLGWFQNMLTGSYVFLAFLTTITVWFTYLLTQANRPVISLGSTEVTFSNFHHPDSLVAIPYARIRSVTTSGEHDSVPNYLVIELDHIDAAERRSPAWTRTQGNHVYFECSNLTTHPGDLRASLQLRIPSREPHPCGNA